MHWFSAAFLTALVAQVLVTVWLARRQIQTVTRHRGRPPESFAGSVTPAEHERSADYTVARQRCSLVEAIYDAGVLLWLSLGGGISLLGEVVVGLVAAPIWQGTFHVLLVFAVVSLLQLPFALYRRFSIEQHFGFNRMTPALFAVDLLKGWALGAILGGAVIALILLIMDRTGDLWWLFAWLAWSTFSVLLMLVWPRLIAPLFNEFRTLDDQALKSRIEALVRRCGFAASGIFVMDGSRRSAHGNAYFTGIGHSKRIVFFDTLLASLTPSQVVSVLAHELAHFKLRHVTQRLALMIVSTLAGFALLGWLAQQTWFYSALGIASPTDAAALLLFVLVSPVFGWLLTPLLAAWSRRHEFEADDFAAVHADPSDLAAALVRLYRDNASTLTPDPVYSAFYDSHPPPALRISRLLARAGATSPAAAAS
jgi:STE24 endopeptidase